MPSFIEHLTNVWMEPNTGCWLWPGNFDRSTGRGIASVDGERMGAHCASFRFHYLRDIPSGFEVRHTCDVPSCVNPVHLRLGTHQDNMDDMKRRNRRKGRNLGSVAHHGETSPLATLTNDKVLKIRADARFHKHIAADYGISRSLVTLIKQRKRWPHLSEDNSVPGAISKRNK